MTKYRYIGDSRNDGDGPDTSTTYGVTFIKHGEAMEVPAEFEGKFAGNWHFEKIDVDQPAKRGPGRPKKIAAEDTTTEE